MPTLLAFEGWSDVGSAATVALRHLRDSWDSTLVASIESEDFFDFTRRRPHVRKSVGSEDQTTWRIDWPDTEIWECRSPAGNWARCIIGAEPHLKWRTFARGLCAAIGERSPSAGGGPVVAIGAVSAKVAHTQRPIVFGSSPDRTLMASLGVRNSTYEGPTGIIGVIQHLCRDRGVSTASFWATVPTYVPSIECPKASLALLNSVIAAFAFDIDLDPIALRSMSYEEQVDELLAGDADLTEFVRRLETQADLREGQPGLGQLAEEYLIADYRDPAVSLITYVEHYLRDT